MKKIEIQYDEKGNIVLPEGAPFDGEPVLIQFAEGICEAWWDQGYWGQDTMDGPAEYEGFSWVCLDDTIQKELDDAKAWMPLPKDSDLTYKNGYEIGFTAGQESGRRIYTS